MIRSGMDEVKASVAGHIRDNFNVANVNGLTSVPTVTQNPTRQTQTPRIYIYAVSQDEIDTTKEDIPIQYTINVEVLVRFDTYRGGRRQAEQMLDEVIGSLRGLTTEDYPTVNGYSIYRIRFGDITHLDFKEEGTQYFKIVCPFLISASELEAPDQVQPVQMPTFTYASFLHEPSAFLIERYDTGMIIPDTTYPSGNNGWNFIDSSFAISAGAAGTFTSGTYSIGSGQEPVRLDSSLRYNLNSDSTEVTSITTTTEWTLIDSLRFGAIIAEVGNQPVLTDDTADTYGLRNLSNWNIEFGTITPHNETITVQGNAGEYVYIIVDSGVTLTQIQNTIGQNAISTFDVQVAGAYRSYISQQPIVFDGFETNFTLIA